MDETGWGTLAMLVPSFRERTANGVSKTTSCTRNACSAPLRRALVEQFLEHPVSALNHAVRRTLFPDVANQGAAPG